MTVYFAHATSFCGGVWAPVVRGLPETECVTWDFAGHGQGPPLEKPVDWTVFGEQVLDETTPGGIGVGHSMGAVALVMAQLADPGRFRVLVLIEPIIFPGPHVRQDHPMSVVAAKRTPGFASREVAREQLSAASVFADWVPEAMDGYVDCGLIGEGPVELACNPEIEADIYRASNAHDTWERMSDVEAPVLILAGETSDTTPPDFARRQAEQFPSAGLEIVEGAGHFLPMEKPDLVARRIRRLATAARH